MGSGQLKNIDDDQRDVVLLADRRGLPLAEFGKLLPECGSGIVPSQIDWYKPSGRLRPIPQISSCEQN
jgi:hypothetical protein